MAFVEVTKQGNVGIITMNRPEALNALNNAVFNDLEIAINTVKRDKEIYVVIITGAGRSFVAGADIGEMVNMNAAAARAFGALGNRLFLDIERMAKPSIAAINGFALGGGCELAMACDIRIASDKARFGQPEVGLGITPGFGGTQRMPRICGTAHAMEVILTGENITAHRALEIGLVSNVVPADQLMDTALELANKIAAQAQMAVRSSKRAIRFGIQCDMDTAAQLEAMAFATCFDTADQKDAMKAFLEKRKLDGFKNR